MTFAARLICAFCFLIGFSLAAISPANAQGTDLERLFSIFNIKVDERARSAARARLAAIELAERSAYDKIIGKLTQPEDREKLPELNQLELRELLLGIEVVEEQTSSRRYRATLNVRFEPRVFSEFLANNKVPHVLSAGTGIMVLHSHKRGLEEVMWAADDVLTQARAAIDWENRIRYYSFPRGNLQERFQVTGRKVTDMTDEQAIQIAGNYDLETTLLVETNYTAGGLLYRYRLSGDSAAHTGEIKLDGGEVAHLAAAYEDILAQVGSAWRERLIVDTGQGGTKEIYVRSQVLGDFAALEKALNDVTLVSNIKILELALPLSRISFDYTGQENQLVMALEFAGMMLIPYGDSQILQLKN